jgi:hypothetical protein
MQRPIVVTVLCTCLTLLAALGACDDASPPLDQGTVTVGADEGVDFATGALRAPGNYANSDLFFTANGDSGMKATTGGANPADNRPITWFRGGGGIAPTFPDLASVPTSPAPTTHDPLVHARANNGFLLRAKNGDLVRGWLARASAGSVTLQWQRVTTAE